LILSLHDNPAAGVSQTCGVEKRAPPIFGRTAITLGIGHILVTFIFVVLLSLFDLLSYYCSKNIVTYKDLKLGAVILTTALSGGFIIHSLVAMVKLLCQTRNAYSFTNPKSMEGSQS